MEDPIPHQQHHHPYHIEEIDDFSSIPLDDPTAMISDDFFNSSNNPLDPLDFDFSFDDIVFADNLLLLNDPDPSPDPSHPSTLSSASDSDPNNNNNPNPNINIIYDCSSPTNPTTTTTQSPTAQSPIGVVSSEESNCKDNSGISHSSSLSGNNNNNSNVNVSSNSNSNVNVSSNRNNNYVKIESSNNNEVTKNSKVKKNKRKKEEEGEGEREESSDESGRTSKLRKPDETGRGERVGEGEGEGGEEDDTDEKRKARLMRNRESAQLSRQRKKQYVEELEDKVRAMSSTITDLNARVSFVIAENAALRQQLCGGGNGNAGGVPPAMPPVGAPMYPPPYMPYGYGYNPWMGCVPPPGGYMMNKQGSQVPLVPIPRLKPQQPAPAPKKSSEGKGRKSEGKTKKVASVSLLGLLFFFVLFGGLVPMMNVRYGGGGSSGYERAQGTVVMVGNRVDRAGYGSGGVGHRGRMLNEGSVSGNGTGNSSEALVASLYVPRNDKLVKIDGNLIIHSILASEKAMEKGKTSEETGLAIANYPPYPVPALGRSNGRHTHLDGNVNGRQRALGPGQSEATKPDGKLQQWFREGLAGPMLSSGMCTEVFQFDVSPGPGAIVPATSIANATSRDRQNSTRLNKPRNRRILPGHPLHTLNVTDEHVPPHEQKDGLHSNKTSSSMVVSVLVDPREAGDGDGEGVIRLPSGHYMKGR